MPWTSLPSLSLALALIGPARRDSVASDYLACLRELLALRPAANRVAEVQQLTLRRDVGQLVFERGTLYELSPVGGRVVGLVFRGQGRFVFAPSHPTEQAELRRLGGPPALDDPFHEVILLAADSTLEQLRGLTFGPGAVPGDVGDVVQDALNSLKGNQPGAYASDVMGPLLNGETSGFFLAVIKRDRGDPVLFELNPALSESVQLRRPVSRNRWGAAWAVVTQFQPQRTAAGADAAWRYRELLRVPAYRLDTRLALTGAAGLDFSAGATLDLVAARPVGPWLNFKLDDRLRIDSARWRDGSSALAFKADPSGDLWVRFPRRLAPGDSASLTVYYHGDLVDRVGDWFFMDPGAAWYPVNGQGPDLATFDLTYHCPTSYPLVSVGTKVDSSAADRVTTTRWLARRPTEYASFSVGRFENTHVQNPGAPPLDVLLSEAAHTALRHAAAAQGYFLTEQRNMSQNVAADVSNSLKTYANLFGSAPYDHFYVTEIPYPEGVSFPGLIYLSWGTFQNTSDDGFDEFFRAHEVAHQWWGNGVRPGSYRDAWLSEGLATFCALWYLQLERRHYDEYFHFLDQYQNDVRADRDAGPIWIGYRSASPNLRRGYDVMVYEKGAWVFHMLRAMMLDLRTQNEDRFTDMMRDFYRSYYGTAATTEDFQRVVERSVGSDMGWFFDQWVKGTDLPTYHVAWRSEPADNGRFVVRLRVVQENVPESFRMPVLVAAELGDHRLAHFRIDVRGRTGEYTSPPIPAEVKNIIFNEHHSVLADVRMEHW